MTIEKKVAFSVLLLFVFFFFSCGKRDAETPKEATKTKDFVFMREKAAPIVFLSTQMNPVEEAGKMRNMILKDFPGKVDFRPNDNNQLRNQIDAMLNGDPSASILVGALHGDLVTLYEENALLPMNEVIKSLENKNFQENILNFSRLDGKESYYVPWMQASFVMVANKKALPFLPKGADVNDLSYDQLRQWAKNIYQATGKKAVGFPVGAKGLMHRFFQGYLYPSYTASTLLKFRGSDAVEMWTYFKYLWLFVHPGSLVYSTMDEPLIAEDVWLAWDHTARLVKAFEQRPDDFIAFPAPSGPKGRGFMSVISGLSIPKRTKASRNQPILIDYLTRNEIQIRTLNETGFFPVVKSEINANIPKHLKELSEAVQRQANSKNGVATLLPIGLGDRAGDFNKVFILTFSKIVLEGNDISRALNANAAELQKILNEQNAKCWLPDVSDARPCKIE
ncbi:MAG: ABC transporter substrate-binding protein [Treponemataceae bacterium]